MKDFLTSLLVCPTCLPSEEKLACRVDEKVDNDILKGVLICTKCNAQYQIADGIASILPILKHLKNAEDGKYEDPSLLSSYIWSHFSDLIEDQDANSAYGEWAEEISQQSGYALDAGCAVGRFTYEMGKKFDCAIGVDNSKAFIKTARTLMKNSKVGFSLCTEGALFEHKSVELPNEWNSEKVEFIVGDIQYLPFRKDTFSCTSSLNLVDRIPMPIKHLKEINRVSKDKNAQFLFSDPFSWSTDVASKNEWLGGTLEGPFPGKGLDNIKSLLTGEGGRILPAWAIKKSGNVWWKIRNHQNHFELIRSCFLKAVR